MFKNTLTNTYEKKRSKLTIKQKLPGQKSGREKRVGVIELDLSKYAAMDNIFEIDLPLAKCSVKNASMTFKLHSLWLKAMTENDDAASVSQLSMVSTGTSGLYHPIIEPSERDDDYAENPD
eukprot:UN24131